MSCLYAVYQGKQYSAAFKDRSRVILRSENLADVRDGFQPVTPDIQARTKIKCVKYVLISELDRIFKRYVKAYYKGYIFEVDAEKEGMLSLYSLIGDYRVNEALGMELVDRGVYHKWVDKQEVEMIVEDQEYILKQ